MFRVGIIGLGHVARHHVAAIELSSDFELVAGSDPDTARHSVLPTRVRAFTDNEAMLDKSELDVVVVASPNRLHVEHGVHVMARGLWLLIEKPLAETSEQFAQFHRMKIEHGGHCSLSLHAAFGREVEWLCRHRESFDLDADTVDSIAAEFDDPYIVGGRLRSGAESRGGSWLDSGINALSVIARFVPIDQLAVTRSNLDQRESVACSEVEAHVEFSFQRSGAPGTGTIDTSWLKNRDRKLTILTDSATRRAIILQHSEQRVVLREKGNEHELFANDNGRERLTNHYIGVFVDLAEQIRSGKDNFETCTCLHNLLYKAAAGI